jgi:hypothetical protein
LTYVVLSRSAFLRASPAAHRGPCLTIGASGKVQAKSIVETSPVLMAYPDARLLRLTKYGLEPASVEQTDHYKVMREFCADPAGFVEAAIAE